VLFRNLLRSAVVNKYLVAAYSAVWLIFMLYAWSLARRQERLRKELEDLKARTMDARRE